MKNYHRPLHLFLPNSQYFVSLTTYRKRRILDNPRKKEIVLESLFKAVKKYPINLIAWVILDDHLHVLIFAKDSKAIPSFIRYLTSRSSVMINKVNQSSNRNFYQYRDRLIRDEKDFFTKLNYIHYNPVHHHYVESPEQYGFSSYKEYLEKMGEEWLNNCIINYPLSRYRYK